MITSDTVPLLILNLWKSKFFEQELAMRKIVGKVVLPKVLSSPADWNGIIFINLQIPLFSVKMLIFHFTEDFNFAGCPCYQWWLLFSKAVQRKPPESFIRSSLLWYLPGSYWSSQSTSKMCSHWTGQSSVLCQSKFLCWLRMQLKRLLWRKVSVKGVAVWGTSLPFEKVLSVA